ncbi:hypothetical protein [Azohydromonas aeria]|uniref:hypothetical protein n=1 Tax=Azohydromonas aeria TaxID=2590212 RepID=UPI0012F83E09
MLALRKSSDRGHVHHGGLDSRHGFSLADHCDPAHMGLGTHGHRDAEIASHVPDGETRLEPARGQGTGVPVFDLARL